MSAAEPDLYFAYGSNMSASQMRRRCPSSRLVGPATLADWRLCFPRWSRRWVGGAASIEPAPGQLVQGVLYQVTDDDLRRLDAYEGVAGNRYDRRVVTVARRDGATLSAWSYVARPQQGGPYAPSRRYLARILEGAREHGVPGDWIEMLEGLGRRS